MEVIGAHGGLSSAEKKVLEWLRSTLEHEQGTIFVELPIKDKFSRCMWPDFVIVSRKYGVCVLECKGYSKEEIRKISKAEDLETVHGVDRIMKQMSLYGLLMRDLMRDTRIDIKKALIFPNILSSDSVAPLLSSLNNDNQQLALLFSEAIDWQNTLETLFGPPLWERLTKTEEDEILSVLNPNHVIEHNYTLDLEHMERRLRTFDKDQIRYLERIQDGHHYVINGLPGTGKTIMLMKLIDRELANGKEVLYTCFNRPLADSIARTVGPQLAQSTYTLYSQTLKTHGISYWNHKDWERKTVETLKELDIVPRYDYLLIDEYQDLELDDYQILLKHLKPGGTIVLAGDKLQNIKGKHDTWKEKGIDVAGGGRSMFLKRPYRTHPDVVDFALKFLCQNEFLEKEAKKYFDHHKFDHTFGDFSEVRDRVKFIVSGIDQTHREIRKVYSDNPEAEILVVSVYRNQDKMDSIPVPPNGTIEPYTRMKGLEADIVILYNVDFYGPYDPKVFEVSIEQKIRSIFTALCRSRGDVYIHCKRPEGFYEVLKEIHTECSKKAA